MDKTSMRGEIMRNAQRLVMSRGDGALEYASKVAERMQDIGDDEDQVFWEKIAAQVELLVHQS